MSLSKSNLEEIKKSLGIILSDFTNSFKNPNDHWTNNYIPVSRLFISFLRISFDNKQKSVPTLTYNIALTY